MYGWVDWNHADIKRKSITWDTAQACCSTAQIDSCAFCWLPASKANATLGKDWTRSYNVLITKGFPWYLWPNWPQEQQYKFITIWKNWPKNYRPHYLFSISAREQGLHRLSINKVSVYFLDNAGSTNKNQFLFSWGMEVVEQRKLDHLCFCFLVADTKFAPDHLFALVANAYNRADVFTADELLGVCQSFCNTTIKSEANVLDWRGKAWYANIYDGCFEADARGKFPCPNRCCDNKWQRLKSDLCHRELKYDQFISILLKSKGYGITG